MNRITTRKAAKITGVHIGTVRRWILAGTLPAVRIGGRYRVWLADVRALVRRVDAGKPARGTVLPATRRELAEAERREAERVRRVLEGAGLG